MFNLSNIKTLITNRLDVLFNLGSCYQLIFVCSVYLSLQVYGFSWIVLVVMVLLFKVYHVNSLNIQMLHVLKLYMDEL
jgi:hypothetical protein